MRNLDAPRGKTLRLQQTQCIFFCTNLLTKRGKCPEVRQSGVIAAVVLTSVCAEVTSTGSMGCSVIAPLPT